MTAFDMPPLSAGFPARGRWLIDRFAADLVLKDFQAAGIVGNLGYESVGLAKLQEIDPAAGRGGYGWEQATGPRRRAFEAWAAAHNLAVDSDEANYGFILGELEGPYKFVVDALARTATIEAAVFVFGVEDEAPGGTTPTFLPAESGRLAYAKLAFNGPMAATSNRAQALLSPASSALPNLPDPQAAIISLPRTARAGLQAGLRSAGVYRGYVDGLWGPLSRAAYDAYHPSFS